MGDFELRTQTADFAEYFCTPARITFLLFFMLMLLITSPAFSQEGPAPAPLPGGYGDLRLGLPLEEVKNLLQGNSAFAYRGDPDVSMLPSDRQPIIETRGRGFMESGVFQFRDELLYSITLRVDPARMDYFTMFRTLSDKYGDPAYLDPQQAYWEDENLRLVLERPVVVKYLDIRVLDGIREAGEAQQSAAVLGRELFLETF